MKSIRRQLTRSILLGFGALLIASGIAIYFFTRAALLNEFDARLGAMAQTVMSLTQQGENEVQLELPKSSDEKENHSAMPQYYELWKTNGAVCSRSPYLGDTNLPFLSGSVGHPLFWNFDLPNGHPGRAIGLKFPPTVDDEETNHVVPTDAIIVVASERSSFQQTMGILATVLSLTTILTLALTVPLVRLALRRGHAPLDRLAGQTVLISADSLQTRFPVDPLPEELRPIATRLNDLLHRLEDSFARERRFSADLAHELRTPLAELRSLAEVALAWPEDGSVEKHRETLAIALQMESLVTRLLELARCENGKITLQMESVSVGAAVEEAWRPLAEAAKGKQLVFERKIPADAQLQTDPTVFRSIVRNLLCNAVEYTPSGGRVEIDARSRVLTISNTVHDLTAADVPHLFERLWRKDSSRTGHEHCGLGLAVSRAFAETLGCTLTAALVSPDTIAFTLALPPNPPPPHSL